MCLSRRGAEWLMCRACNCGCSVGFCALLLSELVSLVGSDPVCLLCGNLVFQVCGMGIDDADHSSCLNDSGDEEGCV